MTWFKQLMEDAKPKAEAVKNAANKVANNRVVLGAGILSHKSLVNTIGVGAVLAAPMAVKVTDFAKRAYKKLDDATAPAVTTVVKK